ncbi:MAG: hypothetical protein LC659_01480, partial [Myxococcales bacterium]|nr:hypothetical protein [Myxococcales bacterium]
MTTPIEEILERAEAAGDAAAQADLLVEAASLYEATAEYDRAFLVRATAYRLRPTERERKGLERVVAQTQRAAELEALLAETMPSLPDGERHQARLCRERLLRDSGDRRALLALLDERTAIDPDDLSALREAAELSESVDAAAVAVQRWLMLRERLPGDPAPLRALDRLYARLGRVRDRVEALEALIGLMDSVRERAALQRSLAAAWSELGERGRAIESLEWLLEYEPDEAVWRALVDHYRAEGRFAAFADECTRHVGTIADPAQRAALWRELATVYERKLADPGQAIKCWKALLELEPDAVDALQALVPLYEAIDACDRAVDCLERWAALSPRDDGRTRAHRLLRAAELCASRADLNDRTSELLERALDADPSSVPVRVALVAHLRQRGEIQRAALLVDDVVAGPNPHVALVAHRRRRRRHAVARSRRIAHRQEARRLLAGVAAAGRAGVVIELGQRAIGRHVQLVEAQKLVLRRDRSIVRVGARFDVERGELAARVPVIGVEANDHFERGRHAVAIAEPFGRDGELVPEKRASLRIAVVGRARGEPLDGARAVRGQRRKIAARAQKLCDALARARMIGVVDERRLVVNERLVGAAELLFVDVAAQVAIARAQRRIVLELDERGERGERLGPALELDRVVEERPLRRAMRRIERDRAAIAGERGRRMFARVRALAGEKRDGGALGRRCRFARRHQRLDAALGAFDVAVGEQPLRLQTADVGAIGRERDGAIERRGRERAIAGGARRARHEQPALDRVVAARRRQPGGQLEHVGVMTERLPEHAGAPARIDVSGNALDERAQ